MTVPPAPDEKLEQRGLVYPHGPHVPESGRLLQVAEGIFWLRMPLPFSLDHINLWVLDGGDHWAIVDTGFPLPEAKMRWSALFEGPLAGKPVGRVIVTHYHPDHIGLAGWLADRWQVPLEASRGEYQMARLLTLDVSAQTPGDVVDFYAAQGWPDDAVEGLRAAEWGRFGQGVHKLPTGYRRLRAGDRLAIGGRHWDVLIGTGHSPEHVCLFDAESRILISGDQVLPRITSNVSVYPGEPEADPLGEWLDSIARMRTLPEDTLVLPAHNEPFFGLHVRLDQLAESHHRKLEALFESCESPRSAHDSFGTLFHRRIGPGELQMATGEALAHLRWLHRRDRVQLLKDGFVDRYLRSN